MDKTDFKKGLKEFYNPSAKEVSLVDVPQMNFIMIDGQGTPESEQFQQAIEALYPIAYAIKFAKKKAEETDYTIMPLEGLWWADDMTVFNQGETGRNQWQWKLMIMQPDFITIDDFKIAREATMKKKNNPDIEKVRFEIFKEGKSAQIMHIGPFSKEDTNIRRVHNKIAEIGSTLCGKHHEIYLSDFRKIDPDKMKTGLRQPYK